MRAKHRQKISRRNHTALLISQAVHEGLAPAEIAKKLGLRAHRDLTPQEQAIFLIAQATQTGMTREEIADELGVSTRSVYRWGAGETAPIPALLSALEGLVERRSNVEVQK